MEALIEAGGPDCQQQAAPPGPLDWGETGYSEQNSFCPGSQLLIFTSRSWNGHHSVIIKATQSHHHSRRLKKISYQAHFRLRLNSSSMLTVVWRNRKLAQYQGGRIYHPPAVLQVGRCTPLQLPHVSLQQCRSCCIPNFYSPDASQMRTMISGGDGGGDVFSGGNILAPGPR